MKNNNNSNIREHIETHQIPQTSQTSAENSQNSKTISENQPADQNNNAGAPQDPAKPANTPSDPPPHLDAQVQANPQVDSPQPAQPAPENHNANISTQAQQQVMVTRSKPLQEIKATEKETPAAPLTKEQVLGKVFVAVSKSDRKPFWQDKEQGEPSPGLVPYLKGLFTDEITYALNALLKEGVIQEIKPDTYKTVKPLPFEIPPIEFYSGESGKVICPQCGKATAKLYDYAGDWLCVDCLNERQHSNDNLFGE